MKLRRFLAVIRARNREFYRDRTSLGWNLLFPLLTVLIFAFIFGGGPADQYKVGVLAPGGDLAAARHPFLDTRHVRFLSIEDEAAGITKVRRHQLDMLLWYLGEVEEVFGYWANLNHPYIEVDDTALAIVKFKSGAIGNILVSNSQKPGIFGKVHIHGENGASVGVQTDGGAMFIAGRSGVAEPPAPSREPPRSLITTLAPPL